MGWAPSEKGGRFAFPPRVSPPAEVAAAIGFADQSHLTKRFKGAFDITPGQFAQAKQRQGDLAAI